MEKNELNPFVDMMLNIADGILAAGSAVAPSGVKGLSYWYINSHSIGLNYAKNSFDGSNSYQNAGKVVGDAITLIGIGKIFKSKSVGVQVFTGATSSVAVNLHSPLGGYVSDVFDTYVRNADEFYTRLYNDEEYRKEILETTKSLLPNYSELKNYYSEVTLEQFWEDLKGVFGRPPSSNEGSLVYNITYNQEAKNIAVTNIDSSHKDEIEKSIVTEVIKHDEIQTLTINSQTYNIKQLSNLQIRNALDSIPEVSFLLSNINLPTREIDLGAKGIYQVKSGETLSQIAQNNNMTTKDLLKLNTWLIDENRVKFLQDKILVDTTLSESELNETNHTLRGDTNAENILIDANGGDNVFIGGSKKDIMQSKGQGYDTYKASNSDEIIDYDGKGQVYLNGIKLTDGTQIEKDSNIYKTKDGIKYELQGNKLIINDKLIIENFNPHQEYLDIALHKVDEIAVNVSNASAKEKAGKMNFTISLSRKLKAGEFVKVIIPAIGNNEAKTYVFLHYTNPYTLENDITYVFTSDIEYEYAWNDDNIIEDDETVTIKATIVDKSDGLIAKDGKVGVGTIIDDDKNPNDGSNNGGSSGNGGANDDDDPIGGGVTWVIA